MPDLSPDGQWLVFDTLTDKQNNIFVVKSDGTALHQLTDDTYKNHGARWSPDGKRIAFQSDRSGKWEIWMINADGSGLQQITFATAAVFHPIWSSDGTRIAYRNPDSNPSIIEVGKSWQEQTPVKLPSMIDLREGIFVSSWSPDGRRLAGSAAGIVVYSLDSHQYEKLTDFGSFPRWLSDSRRLLFEGRGKLYLIDSQTKKFHEVFLFDSQTKRLHEVLSVSTPEFGALALSRDDRLIYYSLYSYEADIWLMTLE